MIRNLLTDLLSFSLLSELGPRERLHFWYSGKQVELAAAIRDAPGLKIAIQISPGVDPSEVTRKFAFLADLLVLGHTERTVSTPFMIMPVPPTFASPRIGARGVRPADVGEAGAVELVPGGGPVVVQRVIPSLPVQELGSLAARCQPSDQLVTARITEEPFPERTYRWLLEDASALVGAGHVVYAPFLSSPNPSSAPTPMSDYEAAALTLLRSTPAAASGGTWLPPSTLEAILQLEIPYLADCPLQVVARLLEDEQDSITYFRNAILSACEKVKGAAGAVERSKEIRRIQRDVIDEGVQRLEARLRAIEKRRWFHAAACGVATVGLEIGAFIGGSPAGLVTAATGAIAAVFFELEKRVQENHELSSNPFHVLLGVKGSLDERSRPPQQPWNVPWVGDVMAQTGGLGPDVELALSNYDKLHPHRYTW